MSSFFEAYIWSQRGKLYRLAYFWVKDRALAEDLLQNVFEKSVEKEAELKEHPNPVGWLMTSLKNEALMHFRQSKRIETIQAVEDVMEVSEEDSDATERVQRVMKLVQGLPEKQREIFQLREVEGLTYEEIASYLEVSEDQVKVNLHRARKSIREKIQVQRK
ncbi:RNA polymerase sigma factor [Algoriphagus sediminis]|uniref:RNA polymerase sigma factor n=1 Tax=Algoriphagus sediminis TaxID=3057113 RepID=A0ABT7YEH3_9BACT|nr:RNA polymerase sigma factor [Algoriphagus sediminis]MDN3204925.1 RNA polymerase sigma factor [Algoriphagus sediminis]